MVCFDDSEVDAFMTERNQKKKLVRAFGIRREVKVGTETRANLMFLHPHRNVSSHGVGFASTTYKVIPSSCDRAGSAKAETSDLLEPFLDAMTLEESQV